MPVCVCVCVCLCVFAQVELMPVVVELDNSGNFFVCVNIKLLSCLPAYLIKVEQAETLQVDKYSSSNRGAVRLLSFLFNLHSPPFKHSGVQTSRQRATVHGQHIKPHVFFWGVLNTAYHI